MWVNGRGNKSIAFFIRAYIKFGGCKKKKQNAQGQDRVRKVKNEKAIKFHHFFRPVLDRRRGGIGTFIVSISYGPH